MSFAPIGSNSSSVDLASAIVQTPVSAQASGVGSAPTVLSSNNDSQAEGSSCCCNCFTTMVDNISQFVSYVMRTLKRWIWGTDAKLIALQQFTALMGQQDVTREQAVEGFDSLSPQVREMVKLTMWEIASRQDSSLRPAEANSDWAGRVIHNEVRRGFENADRQDIAQFANLTEDNSLLRQAMARVSNAMDLEVKGSDDVEALIALAVSFKSGNATREDVVANFNALPELTKNQVKYTMWALAGDQINPSEPQPHDRQLVDSDWAGRVIANQVRSDSEIDDRADIAHYADLSREDGVFLPALEIVAMSQAALRN